MILAINKLIYKSCCYHYVEINDSFDDDGLNDIIKCGLDAAPAIYVPSRTGKSLLLHDGYTFYLKNLQAHGRKQWYCSSRDMAGCRADVITAPSNTGEGDILFLVRGRHIHGPPSYYFTPDGKYVRRKDAYHRYR